jgi:hypothetical protein
MDWNGYQNNIGLGASMDWTEEQKRAYARFVKARDHVGLGPRSKASKGPWIRHADVQSTVDVEGIGHPLFEQNDEWLEYKEASLAWWAVEPQYRKDERLRMSRGDYGKQDSWDERATHVPDSFVKIEKDTA